MSEEKNAQPEEEASATLLEEAPATDEVLEATAAPDDDTPDEEVEEELPPGFHPSAANGVTAEDVEGSEFGKYYIGMWSEDPPIPNYGCPYCSYATIDGEGPVELHVLAMIDSGDVKHMEALNLQQSQGE